MRIIVIDTETGGLIPHKHSLLSIGACDFHDPRKHFYTRVFPADGTTCIPEALAKNGIDPTEKAPSERDALLALHGWLADFGTYDMIANVNVSFDHNFLRSAEDRQGYPPFTPLPFRKVEFQTLAWWCDLKGLINLKKTKAGHLSVSLDSILHSLGMERPEGAHNALVDATLAANAGWELMSRMDFDLSETRKKALEPQRTQHPEDLPLNGSW